MPGTVIRVENLYKEYRLGTIGYGTLREDLQSWFAYIRGKDDPNSIVENRHQKKDKNHYLALNDISFNVFEGETLGIIGKNGAGKSTLLKILSSITAPSKGQIKIKGRISSLLEVGTGFHPELTGKENIFLNGAILGMKNYEINKKIDEIVNFSGIEKFIDTPVKRYSSGMYVRLAFAVAAHLDSDILILDEVLAVGDSEFQKKCLGKMDDVAKKQGRTILFVSHNMGAIKKLCSISLCLNEGKIVDYGNTDDVIIKYENTGNLDICTKWCNPIIKTIELFDILSSRVLDNNGNEKSKFFSNEKIFIEICLIINEVNTKELLCVNLMQESEIVFNFPIFINQNNLLKKGVYKLLIEIPDNFLNNRDYLVSLNGSLYNIKMCFSYDRILKFNCEVLVPDGFTGFTHHPGFILPKLNTNITYLKDL